MEITRARLKKPHQPVDSAFPMQPAHESPGPDVDVDNAGRDDGEKMHIVHADDLMVERIDHLLVENIFSDAEFLRIHRVLEDQTGGRYLQTYAAVRVGHIRPRDRRIGAGPSGPVDHKSGDGRILFLGINDEVPQLSHRLVLGIAYRAFAPVGKKDEVCVIVSWDQNGSHSSIRRSLAKSI